MPFLCTGTVCCATYLSRQRPLLLTSLARMINPCTLLHASLHLWPYIVRANPDVASMHGFEELQVVEALILHGLGCDAANSDKNGVFFVTYGQLRHNCDPIMQQGLIYAPSGCMGCCTSTPMFPYD